MKKQKNNHENEKILTEIQKFTVISMKKISDVASYQKSTRYSKGGCYVK
tara:strand:+ start:323 stop:469 length:147 start_codon:yes stop_codon:yes gene_type:complete